MSTLSNADFKNIYATAKSEKSGEKRKADGEEGGQKKRPSNKGKFVPAHLRK